MSDPLSSELAMPAPIARLVHLSRILASLFAVCFLAGCWLYSVKFAREIASLIEQVNQGQFTVPSIEFTWVEGFVVSSALSLPAQLAAMGLFGALRMKRPYRHRARSLMYVGVYASAFTALIPLASLVTGNFDGLTVGALASLLWNIPVLVALRNPVLARWAQRWDPPAPDLSGLDLS